MQHEITKLDSLELHSLAQSINNREPTILALRDKTEEMASQAVAEAVLQGQDLLAARAKIPKGLWLDWLAANCTAVKKSTAYSYMSLALHWPNFQQIGNATSLRAALLLCERNDPDRKTDKSKACPAFVQTIYLFSRATKFLRKHPIATCPVETQDKLRTELEPTARALWPDRFAETITIPA